MSDTLKVLAQQSPAAGTLTDLYTVPGGKSAVASSIVVCNRDALQTAAFRIAVVVGGLADDVKQYLYYDQEIEPNCSFVAMVGLTLATTDVVRVQSSNGACSFNLFGVEVT
jgi:hypothetical protein